MTPHPYRPFTTRDGSQACADCHAPESDQVHCYPEPERKYDMTQQERDAWCSLASSMRPYTELMLVTLLAVEAGELSEGRAVEMLKVDRMTLREIRHSLITSVVAFSASCKSPLTSLLDTIKDRLDSSASANDQ